LWIGTAITNGVFHIDPDLLEFGIAFLVQSVFEKMGTLICHSKQLQQVVVCLQWGLLSLLACLLARTDWS
jgi:hypothetical protein